MHIRDGEEKFKKIFLWYLCETKDFLPLPNLLKNENSAFFGSFKSFFEKMPRW
jgi:hypothetical protein